MTAIHAEPESQEIHYDWRHFAACLDASPDLFYPDGATGPSATGVIRAQVIAAKEVCLGCPVREACLAWAMDHKEQGIWGGLTEEERSSIVRAEARARRAKESDFAKALKELEVPHDQY